MNVAGIGVDTVEIERFESIAKRRGMKFLEKIFTPAELEYAETKKARYIHMAGKFAAKEAVKKAMPSGIEITSWTDIEVKNDKSGKPFVKFHGSALELAKKIKVTGVLISISHTSRTAVANAMVVTNGIQR
jgi:holo-[acyl-carrier protein] synthase